MQAQIVIDWLKYSMDLNMSDKENFYTERVYLFLSFTANEDELVPEEHGWQNQLRNHKIYKSAMGVLLDIGRFK